MGTLVAKAYPTALFANLADHTYVECLAGGKAWSCWGGKTGGRVIARGTASTKRADCIAQPDEKAGIRCYLMNGVCHQAANRILIEARVTVRAARGYSISDALFGTYGRRGKARCVSPFNRCMGVGGDLPACTAPVALGVPEQGHGNDEITSREAAYVNDVLKMYAAAEDEDPEPSLDSAGAFHIKLFLRFAQYQLEDRFDELRGTLEEVRTGTEYQLQELQETFGGEGMSAREYIVRFDDLTMRFQDNMATSLDASDYRALFTLQPDERVSLVDPRIVEAVYGI
ncbi:MAG TPA: hypothetical protein VFI91_13670 [Longimicrobiaceae bacterium]|nr:hypothetical protein [Longimicrobiaceae bacterium]